MQVTWRGLADFIFWEITERWLADNAVALPAKAGMVTGLIPRGAGLVVTVGFGAGFVVELGDGVGVGVEVGEPAPPEPLPA